MSAVLDFPVKPEARPYLDAFVPDAGEPQWLAQNRRRALARFAETGFPGRRSESWRYLDLQPLAKRLFLPADAGVLAELPTELGLPEAWATLRLLNGNGISVVARGLPPGIWFRPMRPTLTERPDLVRDVALNDDGPEHPFAALNGALFADGYVLDIAPGAAIDKPVDVIHYASQPGAAHTRSLINLAAWCRATVVETYAGKGAYWHNDVLTIRLAEGAELTRIVLVEEAAEAVHLAQVDATLEAKARLTSFALMLGGSRVRQEVTVRLAGEGAQCRVDGAYIVSGNDEANFVATVDHAAPGCSTSELIKGVAAGRGHGAFQGRIIVREHAQKTDAHQLSRNLMIGQRAVIDTKPELEIYADDVKCSHGASVGDLDEAALFYLRARGIPAEEARRMLIEGFLREAVEEVADSAVREHLLQRLSLRLAALEA